MMMIIIMTYSETWSNSAGQSGSIDHHLADLRGKEVLSFYSFGPFLSLTFFYFKVAVKLLINQKIKEDDLIRLQGDAVVLSKLKHPNLVEFLGVCIEKNRILTNNNILYFK